MSTRKLFSVPLRLHCILKTSHLGSEFRKWSSHLLLKRPLLPRRPVWLQGYLASLGDIWTDNPPLFSFPRWMPSVGAPGWQDKSVEEGTNQPYESCCDTANDPHGLDTNLSQKIHCSFIGTNAPSRRQWAAFPVFWSSWTPAHIDLLELPLLM